jgi:hydroxymethylpyrimidine pyrophosphatase-like HAD family hydrolase
MIIAIDFDGTCVTHDYPVVGNEIGAPKIIKKLETKGHQLILLTMRTGRELQDAVDWFKSHNILLWGINENPEQSKWSQSRKVYAQLYIDDAALGCPLTADPEKSNRPFVDWDEVEMNLLRHGVV